MSGQITMQILYQDEAIAVVNKPGGLLAVPGRGPDRRDCVASRIRQLFPWCIEQPAVHRLDMDTSGLMVLGLTAAAHRHLSAQFAERTVTKRYLALLESGVEGSFGQIALRFRLDPDNRPYQVFDPTQGKLGVSLWQKLGEKDGRTLVLFTPLTGRTHQLRLHASHSQGLGCPIVGDRLYGHGKSGDRLMLHASALEFSHPVSGERLHFCAPPQFCDQTSLGQSGVTARSGSDAPGRSGEAACRAAIYGDLQSGPG